MSEQALADPIQRPTMRSDPPQAWSRHEEIGLTTNPSGSVSENLLASFVSLGDTTEFAQLQRLAVIHSLTPGMAQGPFRWLRRLPDAITAVANLASDVEHSLACRLHDDVHPCPFSTRPAPGLHSPLTSTDTGVLLTPGVTLSRQCSLLAALKSGGQVFIWKSSAPDPESEVRELIAELRRIGPNLLLWVRTADADHAAGEVAHLGDGLVGGYLSQFAAYDAQDSMRQRLVDVAGWLVLCQNTIIEALRLRQCGEWPEGSSVSAVSFGQNAFTPANSRIQSPVLQRRPISYETFSKDTAPTGRSDHTAISFLYNSGGLNNQKMALLGLLLTARETGAGVRLPFVNILDWRADDTQLAQFGDVFEIEPILRWASQYGVRLEPEYPCVDGNSWSYFEKFPVFVGSQNDLPTVRATVEALDALRPRLASTTELKAFREFLFEDLKVGAVIQLRIEKDWQSHTKNLREHRGFEGDFDISFSQILSKVQRTLPGLRLAYVTVDEASMPVDKHVIRELARQKHGIDRNCSPGVITAVPG